MRRKTSDWRRECRISTFLVFGTGEIRYRFCACRTVHISTLANERDEVSRMLDAARVHQQTIEQRVAELEKEKVEW